VNYFLYLLFKLFKITVFKISKPKMKKVLNFLSSTYQKMDKRHVNVIKSNLDFVYGRLISNEYKEVIVERVYINLFYNVYEFIVNGKNQRAR